MSASLVGSEMCIRDRPTPTRSAAMLGSMLVALWRERPRSAPRCTNSVSYTHLTLPTICSV
eukprot:14417327-Alexandrium_andersonii.AAC.1